MSRKIIKFCLITIGWAILVTCIVGGIDGIGKGTMIITGTLAIYAGLFIKEK